MPLLSNRRRTYSNDNAYLTFQEQPVWESCCINWGTYKNVAVSDNGDDTVNITTNIYHNSGDVKVLTKTEVESNIDNSQQTYSIGTTNTPIGITQKRCDAVIKMPTTKRIDTNGVSSTIDMKYFRNCTSVDFTFAPCRADELILPPAVIRAERNFMQKAAGGTNPKVVVLPNTLSYIGGNAFYGNTSSFIIILFAKTPPSLSGDVFAYSSISAIYVPSEGLSDYQNAQYWQNKTLKSINELETDYPQYYQKFVQNNIWQI